MAAQEHLEHSKWPLNTEIPNLTGKVALVTDAHSSSGIGFHTAYQLASAGAKVYVGARTRNDAEIGIQEMRLENASIGTDRLVPFVADLSDMKALKKAAQELLRTENRLDLLVNNAAVLSMPFELNQDGVSVSFATNHLGPFLLIAELLPLLKRTAEISQDVRVVILSAKTYTYPPLGIRFDSLASFNVEMKDSKLGNAAFMRYSVSKLANLLFARQLQKRFDAKGVNALAISLHPGEIKTEGCIKMLGPEGQHLLVGKMTPMEGAMTNLFATTNPIVWKEKEKFGGAFLMPPGKIEVPFGSGADDKLADELWATSERAVNEILREY